ncbi:MAG: ABC transporter permease [Acidobacteriota bacterium]
MWRNHVETAWRNILRHRGFSFINIFGLALGMAVCILMLLWVRDELSFDRFHTKADRIYRVVYDDSTGGQVTQGWRTSPPLAPALKQGFPEVEAATALTSRDDTLLKVGDRHFKERALFADSDVFDIFTFRFVAGDAARALHDPDSVVLTRTLAHKIFGNDDPLNKVVNLNNMRDLTVSGVVEAFPRNSEIQSDFICRFAIVNDFLGLDGWETNWGINGFHTFVLLSETADVDAFNGKIAGLYVTHKPELKLRLELQPLAQMHLHSREGPDSAPTLYLFAALAAFVLLIACVNFMNLTTARSMRRAREVGMRRAIGAQRADLVVQFLGESLLVSFVALLGALGLVVASLPLFNELAGKHLRLDILSVEGALGLLAVALLTGLGAGSYPSLYLSSLRPMSTLKPVTTGRPSVLRRILVVGQFSLSVLLVIGTIVIAKQIRYVRGRDVGFARENLVFLPLNAEATEKYDAMKADLSGHPGIEGVTQSSVRIGTQTNLSGLKADWEGKDPNQIVQFHLVSVDYDFVKTFQMQLLEGRDFSQTHTADWNNVILNEEAVRQMGIEAPVGKRFTGPGWQGTIIGVVEDFNLVSLHEAIEPVIVVMAENWNRHIVVRVKPEAIRDALGHMERVWKEFAPSFPFEYHFLDQDFEDLYRSEERMEAAFRCCSGLALVISCLGLLGLASYSVEQRTKEVGIRKVLGATVSGIVMDIGGEFVKCVIASNALAAPLAWLFLSRWLRGFAYHTEIDWRAFSQAAVLTVLVALLTVSWHTIRASRANPVEALRHE